MMSNVLNKFHNFQWLVKPTTVVNRGLQWQDLHIEHKGNISIVTVLLMADNKNVDSAKRRRKMFYYNVKVLVILNYISCRFLFPVSL